MGWILLEPPNYIAECPVCWPFLLTPLPHLECLHLLQGMFGWKISWGRDRQGWEANTNSQVCSSCSAGGIPAGTCTFLSTEEGHGRRRRSTREAEERSTLSPPGGTNERKSDLSPPYMRGGISLILDMAVLSGWIRPPEHTRGDLKTDWLGMQQA